MGSIVLHSRWHTHSTTAIDKIAVRLMAVQHIKDSQSYHFSSTAPRKDVTLPMATAIAVGVHALVIFGISFTTGQTPAEMAQEVATVLTQNTEKNENARFIANASQEGSGQVQQKLRLETNDLSPETSDQMQETQDIINLQKQTRQEQ